MIEVKYNEQIWRLRKTEIQEDNTENICDLFINKLYTKEVWLSIEINGKTITLDEDEVNELIKQFKLTQDARD